jgi:dihydroorotate dehydrogenase electron transfer subunit
MVTIEKIKQESQNHKSFSFKYAAGCSPGQFVMVWLPGIDEKPMSISDCSKGLMMITVERKGSFTEKMFQLKEGDKIGIRGPYGKGFTITEGACIIGGGCGAAPVRPLIKHTKGATAIIGESNKELLLFEREFPDAKIATDDGSKGSKGFTTDVLEGLLKERKFPIVQCCGPEMMMKKVVEICQKHGIECECSLERYMRCGFGICGDCACGEKLVCKDGPVFKGSVLAGIEDFGKYAKTKSGKKISLKKTSGCSL